MGSKSKMDLLKSYKINKKEAEQKLKIKKENALDIISKSVLMRLVEEHHLEICFNTLVVYSALNRAFPKNTIKLQEQHS